MRLGEETNDESARSRAADSGRGEAADCSGGEGQPRSVGGVLLLAATGMRRSEVVGLQWRDRTGDGSIIVRRNRVRDGNEFKTSDTKTGTRGHRTIVVDTDTLAAVEQVRQRQDASGRLCDWIFTHDGLEPFRPEYLTHSYANLQTDGTSVHDLRHWLPAEDQTSADLIAAILH